MKVWKTINATNGKVEENGKPERFYGSKSACPT
jgi:hypothetical protein